MEPVVHVLILAAGASSRMRGLDKLVQPVAGKPILRLVAETALQTGAPVFVALPPGATTRQVALAGLAVSLVEVPDAAQGMSRSIARGLAAIMESVPGPEDGVMILPADMPGFSAPALTGLMAHFRVQPGLIWRGGTADGRAGHPAIFPRDLWPALATVTGDEGGRSVLKRHVERVRTIALPGEMAVMDLDTPEDWAAFNGRPPAGSA